MADGTACFACGYEWPGDGAASPSLALSAAKAPSPAARPPPPTPPPSPSPPTAPIIDDIEDIDLDLDSAPAAAPPAFGGSPFESPSSSNPFAIPRPVTGAFPNPGLAPDLSDLTGARERKAATPADGLEDDLLSGAFLAGASGATTPKPATAPASPAPPPNPFATPAPGSRPGNPFASGSFGGAAAPAAPAAPPASAEASAFDPFEGDPPSPSLPPPPPLELDDEEPDGEDVSWEDLDEPPAPPVSGGLLTDKDASFDDIDIDDEADEPTVDTAHSPAYLAKKAITEPLSDRLILLAAELDADGRFDDAALLHEAARALNALKG